MEKVIIKIGECVVVQHPFLVMSAPAFWCLHCERVHPAVDWQKKDFECPTVHCDGDALDMWAFNRDFYDGQLLPMYPQNGEEGLSEN